MNEWMNDMLEHGCRLQILEFWSDITGVWQHLIISSLEWLQHDACKVILWQHIKVIGLHLRKEEKRLLGVFTLQSFHYCQCPALVDHVGLCMGTKRWCRHLWTLQCVFYLPHMIVMIIRHCVSSFFYKDGNIKLMIWFTLSSIARGKFPYCSKEMNNILQTLKI